MFDFLRLKLPPKNPIDPKALPRVPKILLIWSLALTVFLLTLLFALNYGTKTILDPYLGAVEEKLNPKVENLAVQSIFRNQIPNLEGKWAVVVRDINNEETYLWRENEMMTSASIYKLAVMWATYQALEDGKLQKDEVLSEDQFTLDQTLVGRDEEGQEAEEPSQQGGATVSYTVENALHAMISVSDNYAAILLAEKLGWGNIERLLKAEGVEGIDLTSPNSPFMTATATSDILERIYGKSAVNNTASEEMRDLLLSQKIANRIPKYLPNDIKVGHKTGELDFVRNDAGIIYGRKGNYIFVFLTETDRPEDTSEKIALLSKEIYNALEGNLP
ncbi:MAG: class A beta-lactamase-related serine hydrolase [Candidatus Curtissbacteria bacterium]|nr:class A beta-lactamase-related serine hydrolase [Candidatus Curtissbacteria bacterium]